jgi:hypothetical protein
MVASFRSWSSRRREWTGLLLFVVLGLSGLVFFLHGVSDQVVREQVIRDDLVFHEPKPVISIDHPQSEDADNETHHHPPPSDSKDSTVAQAPVLLAVNDNDVKDDDDTPRSCFVDYRTLLERSADTLQLYRQAQQYGFGNCGENSNATSLDRTVAAFGRTPIIVSRAKQQKSWLTIQPNRQYAPIHHVTFTFQAYTEQNVPRFLGGDEFVVTFKGWTKAPAKNVKNKMAFKTAVVARDNHDGTYSATLPIPRVSLTSYNMTMMHYFTCY